MSGLILRTDKNCRKCNKRLLKGTEASWHPKIYEGSGGIVCTECFNSTEVERDETFYKTTELKQPGSNQVLYWERPDGSRVPDSEAQDLPFEEDFHLYKQVWN